MISKSDIEKVLDGADIIDVVRNYLPGLKEVNGKAQCACPLHGGRNATSFRVDANKGVFYCHSCHAGGNAIQFVEQIECVGFIDAVKKVAEICNIHIEDSKQEQSAEDIQRSLKREAMLIINKQVCEFYASLLWQNDEETLNAQNYLKFRNWGQDYAKQCKLGFAPKAGNPLLKFATENHMSLDTMVEMGLLSRSEKTGKLYDTFRDRIMIPIRSRSNQVIAFSSRLLNEDDYNREFQEGKRAYAIPKYINSKESIVYKKEDSIFGIETAVRQASREGVFYLVEGGPDVMRLHSLGIDNSIAPLGAAWTYKQLEQLKKYNAKLCFIPDCDPLKPGEDFAAGVKNVIVNGKKAVNMGFSVTVKEIAQTKDGEKNDPDSFITSKEVLNAIEEQDFIIWYASKIIPTKKTLSDRAEAMEEISQLVAKIPNATNASVIEASLAKNYGNRKDWHQAVTAARKSQKEERMRKRSKTIDRDTLAAYGFYEDNNCYYSIGMGGSDCQWSNFSMVPLFHIEDSLNPKRLFKIKNQSGIERIIELQQSQLTTVGKFSEKVEGLGNFIWLAKQEQLNKLKMYLYEQTETATEIVQLGWHKKGFWAFGNGIYYNGEFIEADDYGVVRLGEIGNFYLPAFSKIYREESALFQFERKFILTSLNAITLREYTDMMIDVFGVNAKIGMCFLLATLFKDVVVSVTKNFPILNLFGKKGSGKSEMGHSLMAFFVANNTPPNLQNATDAALADAVAQCSNALVHLDEYKNTIDLTRREFLKGLYDGAGRSRMNMDRDKKREMTAVDCGVIVSGQEQPNIDNALFSRLIYLTFNSSEFSWDAKIRFNKLSEIRKLGCSHLTLEILRNRKKFESEFPGNYRQTLSDVATALEKDSIDDRIMRGWCTPLAAFRTLEGVLDLQFTYQQMLKICVEGIVRQNSECRSSNEISQFWNAVEVMHQQGVAISEADFRIVYETSLTAKVNGKTCKQEWHERKAVLYINFKLLLSSYKRHARTQGDLTVPESTLRNYMEVSPEFLGLKTAVRFQMPSNQFEGTQKVDKANGYSVYERTSRVAQAYCFDYQQIVDKYGINLQIDPPNSYAP